MGRVEVGGGQHIAADAEVGHGEVVLQVEEVARRAVVGVEVVDVLAAAALEVLEGLQLGADEGEDGLLLVAEVDDGGVGCGEEVDQGELQRIEVLHLVHLDPAVGPHPGPSPKERGVAYPVLRQPPLSLGEGLGCGLLAQVLVR